MTLTALKSSLFTNNMTPYIPYMAYPTYLVGGAVRDKLLGIPCKDLDYVMLAPSFIAMRDALLKSGCKIFVEKPEYLTIRANHPQLGCVDFACARTDGTYTDGRRPDSTEITTDIELDLSRRDFTCNAIAEDVVTGRIIDPFDGQFAIKQKILMAVGNAERRLSEDKLRAFRALRFTVTRSFIMDYPLIQAIRNLALPSEFDSVSTERIREELNKMFQRDWLFSMHQLTQFGTLTQVIRNRGIWFKPTTENVSA